VGITLAGVGVSALAFAGAAWVIAGSALDEAKEGCASYPDRCTPAASAPNDRAHDWSVITTIALVSGIALTAAGVTLLVWPSPPTSGAGGSARLGVRLHW
jgi:hypothetical protein